METSPDLAPLRGVRFDAATGEGPGDIFSDFLDFLLDAAAFVVVGLVLIGTAITAFFVQAATFLVELGMVVLGAIGAFLGRVAEAVEKVGEALGEFVGWAMNWAVGVVNDLLLPLVQPIAEALSEWGESIVESISTCLPDPECSATALAATLGSIILGGALFLAILAMVVGIAVIETITKPILGISFQLLSFIIDIVTGLIIGALIALLIPAAYTGSQVLADLIPTEINAGIAAAFTAIELSVALSLFLATQTRTLKSLSFIAPVGMAVAVAALLLLAVKSTVLEDETDPETLLGRIMFDVLAIGLALYALTELKTPGSIKRWYPLLSKIDDGFDLISTVAGFTELVSDVLKFSSL